MNVSRFLLISSGAFCIFLLATLTGCNCSPPPPIKCPAGMVACDGTCVNLQSNNTHCGACGTTCDPNTQCFQGRCESNVPPPCAPGEQMCLPNTCVNTQSNPSNCGACGKTCLPTQICQYGRCTCKAGSQFCNGACIDTNFDRNNCGRCGFQCIGNTNCIKGSCITQCAPPNILCGQACVDANTSPNHCGTCGNACGKGFVCKEGACQTGGCNPPYVSCRGRCVDIDNDSSNCGACGNTCPDNGSQCIKGKCVVPCPPQLAWCNGQCIDPLRDTKNCGKCGNVCPSSMICQQGNCRTICPRGQTLCGRSCVDTFVDSQNCGKCGNVCAKGQFCISGRCSCPKGLVACGNQCIDLMSDPKNCGKCSNLCSKGYSCKAGVCKQNKCQSDADCPQKCDVVTGQCVECKIDAHCGPSALCIANACSAIPTNCTKDTDCPKGQVCDPNLQQCSLGRYAGVGQPCGTKKCELGLVCLNVSATDKLCFQPCKANVNCTDAFRNKCQINTKLYPTGSAVSVCLRDSIKNENCGYKGKKQGICIQTANPPLYCDTNKTTCQSSILQTKVGAPCTPPGQNTQPPLLCDPAKQLKCDPATKTCKSKTDADEGEECDPDGRNTGNVINCANGLVCLQFDQSGSIRRCHRICDPNKPGECSYNSQLRCEPLLSNGQGLCYDVTCQTDADCAWKGYQCRQSQGSQQFCYPKGTSGKAKYGEVCTGSGSQNCNTDPTTGGDPSLFCIQTSQNGKGFCSKSCNNGTPCPSYTDTSGTTFKATCTSVSQGQQACIFFCTAGTKCPVGLACQNFGGQAICVAP